MVLLIFTKAPGRDLPTNTLNSACTGNSYCVAVSTRMGTIKKIKIYNKYVTNELPWHQII